MGSASGLSEVANGAGWAQTRLIATPVVLSAFGAHRIEPCHNVITNLQIFTGNRPYSVASSSVVFGRGGELTSEELEVRTYLPRHREELAEWLDGAAPGSVQG